MAGELSKNMSQSQKFDTWANKTFSYPGIDENALVLKKNNWLGTLGSALAILGMTMFAWFIDLSTVVEYGLILLALTIPYLFTIPYMKKNMALFVFLSQAAILLVTFLYMLKLGGLIYSAGLVFSGMTVTISSINYQKIRFTVWLFIIYFTTIIFTAILQPYLTIDEELTPSKNLLFFTVNCLW